MKQQLTWREQFVRRRILEGRRTLEIAGELGIDPNSVSRITHRIVAKSGVGVSGREGVLLSEIKKLKKELAWHKIE